MEFYSAGIEASYITERRGISYLVQTDRRTAENYAMEEKMIDTLAPMEFMSLEEFHRHKYRPSESCQFMCMI